MLKEWREFLKKNPSFGVILGLLFLAVLYSAPFHPETCAESLYYKGENCVRALSLFSWFWIFIDNNSGAMSAIATIFIAWFTLTLKNASIEQGGFTKRAIEISYRGLTIAQWPHFYIDQQRFITPISRQSASSVVQFVYRATVHGASPAIMRAVYGRLIFDVNVPARPPERTDWNVIHGIQRDGFVTEKTIIWEGDEIISTPQDRAKARSDGKWLYAIGCIVYDDLFGNQHEFCFCYRGTMGGGWGIRAGGDTYNYHRLRNDAERAEIDSLEPPRPIEAPEPAQKQIAGKDFPA